MTEYTAQQIELAIDAEALAWADFFRVEDEDGLTREQQIEGRKQVMRANIAVGYIANSLKPFLPEEKEGAHVTG
jgi:hypothetical protein